MTCLVNVGRYTPFTTVPLEITVEILKELDWHSLLKIRLTCKLINALSRVRDIWISQYHQYMMQRMRSARLEEPLDSYSAQELEQWVLVRRSADIGWRCENLKFGRDRWIERKDIWTTYLVPGGRWFLICDMDGTVTTYDLDASTITGRLLIPRDEQDTLKLPMYCIAIDVDSSEQSPNLRFTIALSTPLRRLNTHFWRATLTGHSTEARLTADHLCSLQAPDTGYISSIAIRRNIIAQIHEQEDMSYIEVYDWELSTPSAHCKGMIFPGVKIDAVRLLPGDRLLAFSEEHIMVYHFVIVGSVGVTAPTIASHVTNPLWKLPFTGRRTTLGALTKGVSNGIATYFVVKAQHLYGLIVPHDEHQAPYPRLLMECNLSAHMTSVVGFEKAFMQQLNWSTERLSFTLEMGEDESPPHYVISRDHPTAYELVRRSHLDEETGRIVQELKGGFWVIDYSLHGRR